MIIDVYKYLRMVVSKKFLVCSYCFASPYYLLLYSEMEEIL